MPELQAMWPLLRQAPLHGDHKQFQTLQAALYSFVNGRKWSNESFSNMKIVCNF